MIITVYSKEERAQLEAIDMQEVEALNKLTDIRQENGADSPEVIAAKKEYLSQYQERREALVSLYESFLDKRFSKLKTPQEILEDAKKQAEDALIYGYIRIYPQAEFDSKMEGQQLIISLRGFGTPAPLMWDYETEFLEHKKAKFIPEKSPFLFDAKGMTAFILSSAVDKHAEALKGTPESAELAAIIKRIICASPYTTNAEAKPITEIIPPDSALLDKYMPMYHGKATDILAKITSQDLSINQPTNTATATADGGEFKLVIHGYKDLKGALGINTHKLLCVSVAEFTHINNYGDGINPEVKIPFKEYARALGYDLDERPTTTAEEAKREKKRVQETLKTARKRIDRDLDILHSMELTWTEKIKGAPLDYRKMWLISEVGIEDGYIKITFSPRMSGYLKLLPINQYPKSLLSIDARSATAYRIGLKMAQHYNIDNNQRKGTANRLKVSSLLAVTQLPTYEDLRNEQTSSAHGKTYDNTRHWGPRIKEPFEKALDALTGKVIKDWQYVGAKERILTDEEAESINDYFTFEGLYLQFELIDAPDHSDRLARRSEEMAAATKKAEKRKRKPGRKKAEA